MNPFKKIYLRIRANYLYGKNRKAIARAMMALRFIEMNHQALGWTRRERRQWWRDFVYSPEGRNISIAKYLTQVQKPKRRKK